MSNLPLEPRCVPKGRWRFWWKQAFLMVLEHPAACVLLWLGIVILLMLLNTLTDELLIGVVFNKQLGGFLEVMLLLAALAIWAPVQEFLSYLFFIRADQRAVILPRDRMVAIIKALIGSGLRKSSGPLLLLLIVSQLPHAPANQLLGSDSQTISNIYSIASQKALPILLVAGLFMTASAALFYVLGESLLRFFEAVSRASFAICNLFGMQLQWHFLLNASEAGRLSHRAERLNASELGYSQLAMLLLALTSVMTFGLVFLFALPLFGALRYVIFRDIFGTLPELATGEEQQAVSV